MSLDSAVRSIPQEEANECLKDFFVLNNNSPVKHAVLAGLLKEKLQANSNQCSGLINRAHAPKKGEAILIKDGKEYSLKGTTEKTSIIDDVRNQISNFHKELSKTISVDKVNSTEEFNEIKDILKRLKELAD